MVPICICKSYICIWVVYLYKYIYIYTHVCIYTYVHVQMYTVCICMCMRLCLCIPPGKGGAVNTRHGTIYIWLYMYMYFPFFPIFICNYLHIWKDALIDPALDQDGNFHPNPQWCKKQRSHDRRESIQIRASHQDQYCMRFRDTSWKKSPFRSIY